MNESRSQLDRLMERQTSLQADIDKSLSDLKDYGLETDSSPDELQDKQEMLQKKLAALNKLKIECQEEIECLEKAENKFGKCNDEHESQSLIATELGEERSAVESQRESLEKDMRDRGFVDRDEVEKHSLEESLLEEHRKNISEHEKRLNEVNAVMADLEKQLKDKQRPEPEQTEEQIKEIDEAIDGLTESIEKNQEVLTTLERNQKRYADLEKQS